MEPSTIALIVFLIVIMVVLIVVVAFKVMKSTRRYYRSGNSAPFPILSNEAIAAWYQ